MWMMWAFGDGDDVDMLGRVFGNTGADDGEIFLGIGTGSSCVDKGSRAGDQIAVPDDAALQMAWRCTVQHRRIGQFMHSNASRFSLPFT